MFTSRIRRAIVSAIKFSQKLLSFFGFFVIKQVRLKKVMNRSMKNFEGDNPDSVFNIQSLILSFWNDKLIFILAFFLSIPCSMYYLSVASPSYIATAVLESKIDKDNKRQNVLPKLEYAYPLISSTSLGEQLSDFLPKITGYEFLGTIVGDGDEIDRRLQKLCQYYPPSWYSLSSIFDYLGITNLSIPNEQQKKFLVIECLKRLMIVEKYTYEGRQTSAYKVSIEEEDPFLAAALANKIVEKFFEVELEKAQNDFQSSMKYLTEVLSQAKKDVQKYEDQLQAFLISNARLVSSGAELSTEAEELESIFKKKIYRLGLGEQVEKNLIKNLQSLKKLKGRPAIELYSFVDTVGIKGGLSSRFISNVIRSRNSLESDAPLNPSLMQNIEEEIKRLGSLLRKKEKQLGQDEKEVETLMQKLNDLKLLNERVLKSNLYYAGIQDQLATERLEAGALSLASTNIYSKAVPPLYPVAPKKKIILVLFASFFIFLVAVYSFSKLHLNRTVYTLSQLRRYSHISNLAQISVSSQDNLNERKQDLFGLNFMDDLLNSGKVGCVVDISNKGHVKKNLAENVSRFIGKMFSRNENTLLYNSRMVGQDFKLGASKSTQLEADNPQDILNSKFVELSDKTGLIESGDFFPLQKEYASFDRILISLNHGINELTKLETIRNCDYYILIGKKGKFSFNELDKFTKEISSENLKCIALVMIR